MNNFEKLGIAEPILRTIEKEQFQDPTEIQEKSIPNVLEGKDILAGSATGSGKTLAFGCGIIQNSEKGRGIQALVLAPTRELAEQVKRTLEMFARYKNLHIISVYGGVAIGPQMSNLKTADVVIGTPGRVLDHIGRGTIDLSNVSILVLDEADKMFDMGFFEDVERIIMKCPKNRQTMLFSATLSRYTNNIARKYMCNPIEIQAKSHVDPTKLKQIYYDVSQSMKFSLLAHLLKQESAGLVMVFCATRRNTDFVAKNLKALGIDSIAIHGGLTQAKRNSIMKMFRSERVEVLVCTDVAARGLDIQGISHVYNYDIPKDSKEYVHRIGRTARAGKKGRAINLLSRRDYDNFTNVKRDSSLNIIMEETPEIEKVEIKWKERPRKNFSRGRNNNFNKNRGGGKHGRQNRRYR